MTSSLHTEYIQTTYVTYELQQIAYELPIITYRLHMKYEGNQELHI